MIEFDVETTGLQWYGHKLFLVQFYDQDQMDEPEVLKHPQDKEAIQDWLDADDDFRAWNSKFDLHFLEAAGYKLPPQERWHDGMVLAHIIDERRSAALQNRGDLLLGDEAGRDTEVAVKEWLKLETKIRRAEAKEKGTELIRPNYSDVPDEIMFPYAAHDVWLQRQICDIYEDKLAPELRPVYELEQKVLGALYDVEKLGINMDVAGAERLASELEADLDRLTDEAVELSGDPDFNPGSNVQLAEALVARNVDLTFARKLKNGLPSVDAETLEIITDDLGSKISELRQTQKVYKTYVYPMLNAVEDKSYGWRAPFIANDGRLHADLRQVGARTARMSSSPNVQNWPRDDLRMRHLAMAQEGHSLVAVDLDSIELKLFAAFVGEGKLLEMTLDPDADLHTYTAKMIGLGDRDRGGGIVEPARQRGKKFNYERIYGGGVRAIRRWHGVSQETAKEMLWKYRETFPEIVDFQNRIEFALYDVGYVKTPWGRRHRADHPKYADRESYKFVNYIIQGTAADLFKESVVRVHKMGIPMVALTHDEILAEVRDEEAEEVGEEIRQAMIDHPRISDIVPLDAEAKIVKRWSYAKDKDFVPGYERN